MEMFKSTFWLSDLISVKFYKLGAVAFKWNLRWSHSSREKLNFKPFMEMVSSVSSTAFIFIFMRWIAQQQILYNAKYQTVNNWRQCGR